MNLELNDAQTEALIGELDHIVRERPLPPQSTHCGTERDPSDAATGARTRASARAAALRATEQG